MTRKNHPLYFGLAIVMVEVAGLAPGSACRAQEDVQAYARPYTASDARADAYRRNEARRRARVGQQLGVVQYVRWLSGRPATVPVHGPPPADRATFYAYRGSASRARGLGVFERWPYLPGDIWGFVHDTPVRQSVGQRDVQTGPRRWESRTVYPGPPTRQRRVLGPRSY